MAVDPITDVRFLLFDEDERAFLKRIFQSHTEIENNFDRYLSHPARLRPLQAMKDLMNLPRKGWVKRTIEGPETVAQHSAFAAFNAMSLAPAGIDPIQAYEMASMHDMAEAIMTDFTPSDPILPEEKARLELLGLRVLLEDCEGRETIMKQQREYIEQNTPLSQWVRDVDLIDAVFVALQYEAKYPEKMGVYEEFRAYTKTRLKTDTGREIFADLQAHADDYREAYGARGADRRDGRIRTRL